MYVSIVYSTQIQVTKTVAVSVMSPSLPGEVSNVTSSNAINSIQTPFTTMAPGKVRC